MARMLLRLEGSIKRLENTNRDRLNVLLKRSAHEKLLKKIKCVCGLSKVHLLYWYRSTE
jgi:hypothetical protein